MATILECRRCGDTMTRIEQVTTPGEGPQIDIYACPREECLRKVAVIYEPDGGLTDAQQSWVEKIIAERGAFFPTDFTQSRGPRFGYDR